MPLMTQFAFETCKEHQYNNDSLNFCTGVVL